MGFAMDQSNADLPRLMRMNANPTPKLERRIRQTPEMGKVHNLAYDLFSVFKQGKVHSIKHKILKTLIKKHLKLKSSSKARYFLNELIRLNYIAPTTLSYTFTMQAAILLG